MLEPKEKLKAVLDANIVVSEIISLHGVPRRILESARDKRFILVLAIASNWLRCG